MICREWSIVHYDSSSAIALPLECRAWNCEYCRPRRKRELIELAVSGSPNRLLTLTVNPKVGISPADRAAKLARAWRVVVARAKRKFKLRAIEYFAVFEATKRGEPHLHILLRSAFLPQRWLSAQMAEILASPVVDIRKVKGRRQAAAYVAKYVGKAPHRFATCKRYWYTRGWQERDPEPPPVKAWEGWQWRVVERSVHEIVKSWLSEGRTIDFDGEFDVVWYGQPPPWRSDATPGGAARRG